MPVEPRYSTRPRANDDLDEQAFYLAQKSGPELAHRFLVAARETFALLALRPRIGWKLHTRITELGSLRAFSISGFERMLVLRRPLADGIDVLRVIHGSRDLAALLRREPLE